jgi:hypothetical protein
MPKKGFIKFATGGLNASKVLCALLAAENVLQPWYLLTLVT